MPEFDSTIEYRPIPSLPTEFYRAGSDGSIWGCQNKGKRAGTAGKWRRLKERKAGVGYLGMRLGVNGVRKNYYTHRLVLEAFHGPGLPGKECLHCDGNRANNQASNLRWGTRKENCDDILLHGTRIRGSLVSWSKLKEEDIPSIRRRIRDGEKLESIASDYKVDSATIGDIRAGKTWKHVE